MSVMGSGQGVCGRRGRVDASRPGKNSRDATIALGRPRRRPGLEPSAAAIAATDVSIQDDLQRFNGLKNVLALVVNAVAAVVFIAVAPVDWGAAALIAVGSIAGGQIGAAAGRRMSPRAVRIVIVIVGVVVALKLLTG
jgi:hypothetical protein